MSESETPESAPESQHAASTGEAAAGLPAPSGGTTEVIQTDYQVGQHNITPKVGPLRLDIHNPVFAISGAIVLAFTVLTLALPEQAGALFGWLRPAVTNNFDWFFLLGGNIFVILCIALILSPLGRIRLGGPDATPDHSNLAWFSMLFAAGMASA